MHSTHTKSRADTSRYCRDTASAPNHLPGDSAPIMRYDVASASTTTATPDPAAVLLLLLRAGRASQKLLLLPGSGEPPAAVGVPDASSSGMDTKALALAEVANV